MRKLIICLFAALFLCLGISAQTTSTMNQTQSSPVVNDKPKRTIFRATKEQVMQVQKMLKVAESGKLSKEDREAVKKYQAENGLKATGGLNRATLEKMGIELTDKQKEIPVSPNSFASADSKSGEAKKRGPVFRATKDQVMQAQKMLKVSETGKLSDDDREALKKYQASNGIKATGGLNKVTLEKMGITLTDKQREM